MIRTNKTIEDQIKLLNDSERVNRQFRKRYEKGIIKNLSPQGDRLYASVQRLPSFKVDENGKTIKVDGLYFGNENGYPEDDITLSELLIQTDIDLSIISGTLEHFIGKEVTVESIDNFPEKIYIQSPYINSRVISTEELRIARLNSEDLRLDDSAREYLLSAGYSMEKINATFDETLESVEGSKIFSYGAAAWQSHAEDKSNYQELEESSKAGIVTDLPSESDAVPIGLCFKPNKALTAK